MQIKDRIKVIMDNEGYSPTKFADFLQINRAVVSHILTGRNKPSLEVVTKILSEMKYVNSDWLLSGSGEMYNDEYKNEITNRRMGDLFSDSDTYVDETLTQPEYHKEIEVKSPVITYQNTDNKSINLIKDNERKISKIIIYYDDKTFETFIPDKSSTC